METRDGMHAIIHKCLPTYQVVEKIGEGVHGNVYRVRDEFKERAVKVVCIAVEGSSTCRSPMELDARISQDFHAVRDYYESIKGPGVVEIHDFHMVDKQVSPHEAQGYLVILMEFCPRSLQGHVLNRHPLPPQQALDMARELAGVLDRLSRGGGDTFLMTDLKPSNLLITRRGRLVIGDLGGLKRVATVSTTSSAQFSPNWSAPDLLLHGERPRLPAVVYAFGLIGFYLLEGRLPYADETFMERIRRLRANGVDFGRNDTPPAFKDLIRHCLAYDPEERPGDFRQVLDRLPPPLQPDAATLRANPPPPTDRGPERPAVRPAVISLRPGLTRDWIEPITEMHFVAVPGGRFVPCREGTADLPPPAGQGVETLPFWIGKYPVTQGQWQKVMGGNPSRFQGGDDCPVEQVTWHEAIAFAQRLSELNRQRFRFTLPTEAQWEFACRGGNRPEPAASQRNLDATGWYNGNSPLGTHPVGQLRPNTLGIYDMCGNVTEWCADLFHPLADAADSGDLGSLKRVGRGGSWSDPAERCRAVTRRGYPAGLRYSTVGLRLVRLPFP